MSPSPDSGNPAPKKTEAPDTYGTIIKGHRYDGIQEYDNPMPGWWVWIFYGTIAFSLFYVLGLHVFDFVDTYEDDYNQQREVIAMQRTAYEKANPTFQADEASLAKYTSDPAAVAAGKATFASYCAACHGNAGEGLIGPNLADEYWIHGASDVEIFTVISAGVAAKGMPAWEASISGEQRAQVLAFIRSLEGTNPAGAKAPEGEPAPKS